jgi:hypothetical protein
VHNCSFPLAHLAAEATFTSWIPFKRLAIIAEIYDGQTSKAYNRLKTIITEKNFDVNEKYEKPYLIELFIHMVAMSNSSRALKLDDHDRRWFVPGITENGQPKEYFVRLRAWLEDDGLGIILNWAKEYVVKHGPVEAGQHAPPSEAKIQSIEEGRSEGEQMIASLGDILIEAVEEEKKYVLRLDHVRKWLAMKKAGLDQRQFGLDGQFKLESPEKISSIFRGKGLWMSKQMKKGHDRFRVVANFPIEDDAKWDEIRQYEQNVVALAP